MSELNHIEQAIEQTQLDVCFETIALHALTPILRASDAGKLIEVGNGDDQHPFALGDENEFLTAFPMLFLADGLGDGDLVFAGQGCSGGHCLTSLQIDQY